MKNRWLRIAAIAAGWTFLGLVLSLELYFNSRAEGNKWSDFEEIAVPQFGRAAMWACLAPFILMLRDRMPLSRGRWVGGILFHIAFSFIVMATFYLGRIEAFALILEPIKKGFWHEAYLGFYGHNLVDIAYYWAVIAFGYGVEFQRKFKNEEIRAVQLESKLVEAELKLLREQIKPHFLFNTLNTVSVLVRDGKNDLAVTLLSRLGSLLRMSLDRPHENVTTLQAELDFLDRYVDIQKARFSDRLTVEVSIDDSALGMTVPWLILQPIVENAILHGVAPKDGPGRVDVLGRIRGNSLHLEVSDDGPGMGDIPNLVEGTGLANTRARLQKIYGDAATMALSSRTSGGFTVEIAVPCSS
jgi:two-component system, LytTR family, sensor kinase